MALKHCVVAVRAVNETDQCAYLGVSIQMARLNGDFTQHTLQNLRQILKKEQGWSHWAVELQVIPPEIIKRVILEAQDFDQSNVNRLFGVVILGTDPKGRAFMRVGYNLALGTGHAECRTQDYIKEYYPEADGWHIEEFKTAEWKTDGRRQPTFIVPLTRYRGISTH